MIEIASKREMTPCFFAVVSGHALKKVARKEYLPGCLQE